MKALRDAFMRAGWFNKPGAYVLVDGQFGSTGKGLVASAIGEMFHGDIDWITTNAGPNSGHTGYIDDTKIVTTQLPVAWCVAQHLGAVNPRCLINAGAIINTKNLLTEIVDWRKQYPPIYVHKHAALIDNTLVQAETTKEIASTGKLVGEATARKILRDPKGVFGFGRVSGAMVSLRAPELAMETHARIFIETAQGFSLGINSGFYPHTTSRECTVAQALADAGLSPRTLRRVVMVCRTLPIRVGSTPEGYSGDVYPDQKELDWVEQGIEPEFTTVTGRQRRLFSWSWHQFRHALAANQPDTVVINFMQYIKSREAQERFLDDLLIHYRSILNKELPLLLTGWGPKNDDLVVDDRSTL